MSAQQYNFSIEQGSSFELTVIYSDSNGNPIDLTGWKARLVIARRDGNNDIFLTTNTNLSLYKFSINGPSGQVLLQIPPSVTNEYSYGSGKYDLELESDDEIYVGGGNNIKRLLYGDVSIIKRYSKLPDLLD